MILPPSTVLSVAESGTQIRLTNDVPRSQQVLKGKDGRGDGGDGCVWKQRAAAHQTERQTATLWGRYQSSQGPGSTQDDPQRLLQDYLEQTRRPEPVQPESGPYDRMSSHARRRQRCCGCCC